VCVCVRVCLPYLVELRPRLASNIPLTAVQISKHSRVISSCKAPVRPFPGLTPCWRGLVVGGFVRLACSGSDVLKRQPGSIVVTAISSSPQVRVKQSQSVQSLKCPEFEVSSDTTTRAYSDTSLPPSGRCTHRHHSSPTTRCLLPLLLSIQILCNNFIYDAAARTSNRAAQALTLRPGPSGPWSAQKVRKLQLS